MDDDMARILATGGWTASRELERLYDIVRHHMPDNKELLLGIAAAMVEIDLKVKQPAYDACPALEAEFERRLEIYGVVI